MEYNNQFQEWQKQWQDYKPAGIQLVPETMLTEIQKYQRHMKKRNLFKTAAIALILLTMPLYFIMRAQQGFDWTAAASLFLIIGGTVLFMIQYWRVQLRLRAADFSLPAVDFIPHIVSRMEAQKRLFQVHFPLFAIFLIAALNLFVAGLHRSQETGKILLVHFSYTMVLVLTTVAGIAFRRRLFRSKALPILNELKETETSWRSAGPGSGCKDC